MANRPRPAHSGCSDVRDPARLLDFIFLHLQLSAVPHAEAHGGSLRGEANSSLSSPKLLLFTRPSAAAISCWATGRANHGTPELAFVHPFRGDQTWCNRAFDGVPAHKKQALCKTHAGCNCEVVTAMGKWACPSASRCSTKQAVAAWKIPEVLQQQPAIAEGCSASSSPAFGFVKDQQSFRFSFCWRVSKARARRRVGGLLVAAVAVAVEEADEIQKPTGNQWTNPGYFVAMQ